MYLHFVSLRFKTAVKMLFPTATEWFSRFEAVHLKLILTWQIVVVLRYNCSWRRNRFTTILN